LASESVQFDDIVVGGGTAGAVIAARLSEERDRRVLLLEAGPDYPDNLPPELLDASSAVTSGHNWDIDVIVSEGNGIQGTGRRARISRVFELASSYLSPSVKSTHAAARPPITFPYPLGKVMGGSSAINGCMALHARPEDYAVWTAAGNSEWSWDNVRPYIGRIANADSAKPALRMEATSLADLTPCQRAFLDACQEFGNGQIDLAQGTAAGVGAIPKNAHGGRRVSTSALYLTAARKRANLTIQPNCLVDKLFFEGGDGTLTAAGVDALVDGKRCRFSGGHIVLSAGAINSPAILLRSGIGAATEITQAAVKPLLDLPGVGKNLQDHPAVSIWATPKEGSCRAGEMVHQLLLQQRSSPSEPVCDLQLFMLSAIPARELPRLHHFVGCDLAMGVSAVLATPRSRGRVEIVDADAAKSPRIHLNCLQEIADLRRMTEGVRWAWRILCQESLALHTAGFVLWDQKILDSNELLEGLIRTTVRTIWHPVGTLRMGTEKDPLAVVDQRGRLYGCRNVTVADASIMPAIPSVPPNLTCMLIGERIAAHLCGPAA
jgi:choline dehydrogenase